MRVDPSPHSSKTRGNFFRLAGAQVSAVLDRKEALLMQLRNMNDEAEAGLHLDNTGRHTEVFQVQYAQIVLELKQARQPSLPHNASLCFLPARLESSFTTFPVQQYSPVILDM